jgi:hypothetical protein
LIASWGLGSTAAIVEPVSGRLAHLVVSVMLDMVFGGLVRVASGNLGMPMRDEGLMCRVRVIVFLVVLGRFAVVARGQFVMFGRGKMLFFAREQFRHGVSNSIIVEQGP